jgi:hypothetical protein
MANEIVLSDRDNQQAGSVCMKARYTRFIDLRRRLVLLPTGRVSGPNRDNTSPRRACAHASKAAESCLKHEAVTAGRAP